MHDSALAVSPSGESSEQLWLLGQPDLGYFLKFVRDKVVGGGDLSPKALVDEWRRANDYYYELEESEAGVADEVECRQLDRSLLPLIEKVRADPRFQRGFDSLPTGFGMVELDRLVVYQPNVTLEFVDELKIQLGPDPDPQHSQQGSLLLLWKKTTPTVEGLFRP